MFATDASAATLAVRAMLSDVCIKQCGLRGSNAGKHPPGRGDGAECCLDAFEEKEVVAREKKAGKEMASAAKQVHENVKRTAELNKQEAEVRACLRARMSAQCTPAAALFKHDLKPSHNSNRGGSMPGCRILFSLQRLKWRLLLCSATVLGLAFVTWAPNGAAWSASSC
eukprot:1143063-Pelagomonas_calceolata.AAC.4